MKITLGRVRTPDEGSEKNLGTVPGRAGLAAARVTTGWQGWAMATETRARPEDASAEPKRRFRFPTAFTVLFFVLVLIWILTFIIKPGTYSYVSCDGASPKPVPGTFENFNQNLSVQERLYDLWLAPVNGLYGIRTPAEPVSDPGSGLLKKAEAACGKVDGKQVPAEVVTPPGNTGPYNSGDLAGAVQVSSSCWRSARSSPSPSRPGRWTRASAGLPTGSANAACC